MKSFRIVMHCIRELYCIVSGDMLLIVLYFAVLCCVVLSCIVLHCILLYCIISKFLAEPMVYTGINKLYFSYLGTLEKFPPMACQCFLTTLCFQTIVHGFDFSN